MGRRLSAEIVFRDDGAEVLRLHLSEGMARRCALAIRASMREPPPLGQQAWKDVKLWLEHASGASVADAAASLGISAQSARSAIGRVRSGRHAGELLDLE